ncbi:hypothetical protein [Aneurinibacillus migulanus]|uniref:Uncharacterized protein n=1 Tax=Aneurinibacillus migulanus TaxID=47500 RepID=A0A0D1YNV5_ANEMI|nr:hypothetical protein [Aneurinibacillus migulanus]KIV60322.1 hypothetical protein TS65_00655 [Aneurinibacillus migulanus]KON90478.1 hypothetical protein AF333_28760 [Aneurinibacillus migulanus]MED0894952.1 hypothetical protein [Aneurinibacillus migulanus]MED1614405.1 hypothetical protein [Aneurinibacillus migulanus]SDJ78737.1 hypothetical protein SAMN04487909_12883 [Aneurinibacillus migulanus]
MDKLQEKKNLGDDLFTEMVADIKQYIHVHYQTKRYVPSVGEILSDMVYTGNLLINFLNGLRPVRKEAVHHFAYLVSEVVQEAKYEYEGRRSA